MPYDAILIPGGGVRDGGILPDYVAARLDRALVLARDAFLVPLSAGTPHRQPPLDARGFPITEARSGADYLLHRGVPRSRILIEESSLDTIGNAYFSRVIHAIPRQFRRILVITSAFHMPRTEAAFRWIYALDAPGPPCAVDFETVPDIGIDAAALEARIGKERQSLAALRPLIDRIRSLADLHLWLFTRHDAYAAGPRTPAAPVDHNTY